VLLVVVVGLAVLAWPSWWRRRRTRRRLTTAASSDPASAGAAWAELLDLTVDHDLPHGGHHTVRQTANQIARDAHLGSAARAGLRRIALATEAAWYSADGFTPDAATDLAADVRQIARELQSTAPRSWRLRILPRSFTQAVLRRLVPEARGPVRHPLDFAPGPSHRRAPTTEDRPPVRTS
jgi:hypothetical protein